MSRRRNQVRRFTRPLVEPLEPRLLLVGDYVFARFGGAISSDHPQQQIPFTISPADFQLTSGKAVIGFDVLREGSGNVDPAAVEIRDAQSQIVTPRFAAPDWDANARSRSIVQLSTGSYTAIVGGDQGTTGTFRLDLFLAGDMNGDRTVDLGDLKVIRDVTGSTAGSSIYRLDADANLDGIITSFDYTQARDNLNSVTHVNPLTLTLAADPAPVVLPDGTLATRNPLVTLQGTTLPAASLALETGSDGGFDNGSTVAGVSGSYAFPQRTLQPGTNVFQVRAADNFGQSLTAALSIALDTEPPQITVQSSIPPVTRDSEFVVVGQVTDNLSGVQQMLAAFDSGSFFGAALDASGHFMVPVQLAKDGSADGQHVIHLRASDRVGNVSADIQRSFVLDTVPPPLGIDLAPASDTLPLGDHHTSESPVDLRGQTEPNLVVALYGNGGLPLGSTTSDAGGVFSFPGISLELGQNDFVVRAVDAAGNDTALPASFTRDGLCAFDSGLTGWTVAESGGSTTGKGGVTAAGCQATLTEGDSFAVTLSRTFIVPSDTARLSFVYSDLVFDTSDKASIKDAFEVAVVDQTGHSLVPTFGSGRDAFFNLTEELSAAIGSRVSVAGNEVILDLAGVAAGSSATLVFRLVNNDRDQRTKARIDSAKVIDSTPAPLLSATATAGSGAVSSATMAFEANNGQTDEAVRFLARGSRYSLFLTTNEAVLSLEQTQAAGSATPDSTGGTSSSVVRMRFVGANDSPAIFGRNQLPGHVNYFRGNDPSQWRTDIPTFGEVYYSGIYPGIDLVFYGSQSQLEFDFVVAPSANPSAIALRLEGADQIGLDERGNLVLTIGADRIVQHAPIMYQQQNGVRRAVVGSYVIGAGQEVRFNVGNYDHSLPLIIDPILKYASYFGGHGDERAISIALAENGNIVIAGHTNSTDFPTTTPIQGDYAGTSGNANNCCDAFITALDASGQSLIYSTYLGGSGGDHALGVAVDSLGNAYISGPTDSRDFPTFNAYQSTYGVGGGASNAKAFVTKVTPTGSLAYSTYLGGSDGARGLAIAVDSVGRAYVTGQAGAGFPIVSAAQTNYGGGLVNAFVTRFSADGRSLEYSTYLGGSGSGGDYGYAIAVDSAGSAYVAGLTRSTNFPTKNAFQPTFAGGGAIGEGFVTKVSPTGSTWVYSSFLGGSRDDRAQDIAVDSSGAAYVSGYTDSTDFPVVNPFQNQLGGNYDSFVSKVSPAGNSLLYSTYLGGSGDERGNSLALGPGGAIYLVSGTDSSNYPLLNPLQSQLRASDGAISVLNSTGDRLLFSSFLGGSLSDGFHQVAVDSQGFAYVSGETNSSDFPVVNPLQPMFKGGGRDAIVAKILVAPPPTLTLLSPADGTQMPAGSTVLVTGASSVLPMIDGRPVDAYDSSGNFFTRVLLSPGVNDFDFTATDTFGQSASARLSLMGGVDVPQEVDFSLLSDVSASFAAEYGRTTWVDETSVLYADLAIRNTGQYPAGAPLLVGVTNLSDPAVRVREPDGVTPAGLPYYDLSQLVAGGTLAPGGLTAARSIGFLIPIGAPSRSTSSFLASSTTRRQLSAFPIPRPSPAAPIRTMSRRPILMAMSCNTHCFPAPRTWPSTRKRVS